MSKIDGLHYFITRHPEGGYAAVAQGLESWHFEATVLHTSFDTVQEAMDAASREPGGDRRVIDPELIPDVPAPRVVETDREAAYREGYYRAKTDAWDAVWDFARDSDLIVSDDIRDGIQDSLDGLQP